MGLLAQADSQLPQGEVEREPTAHNQRPEVKAAKKAWEATAEGKAWRATYLAQAKLKRAEVRAAKKAAKEALKCV